MAMRTKIAMFNLAIRIPGDRIMMEPPKLSLVARAQKVSLEGVISHDMVRFPLLSTVFRY
jgi:hypothetical protein